MITSLPSKEDLQQIVDDSLKILRESDDCDKAYFWLIVELEKLINEEKETTR